jgi:hypothetical protein
VHHEQGDKQERGANVRRLYPADGTLTPARMVDLQSNKPDRAKCLCGVKQLDVIGLATAFFLETQPSNSF